MEFKIWGKRFQRDFVLHIVVAHFESNGLKKNAMV